MVHDIMIKPIHDIPHYYHHWPESCPTQPTNQEESTWPSQTLATMSSNLKQSTATNKIEYTITQQGLPD